ncbi:hypothetical protein BGZ65_012522 [Modicella reniformis]|uniref:Major facilitator superfamily (MFS) profile domain-containing protein n=1 Tax=Modicella reniformis TaxID=1440133 RepID=A0A9P6J6X5_9FUNG|nr:hypothetical protein BGZ65_012522 [Modicella reniformis]
MPLIPFIIEGLGLKSTANGALIAAYAVGSLIASPIAGILSDRMANRRTPMIVGLIALLLSTVLFMEAMEHFWILLVSRFAAGLAGGTMMTLGFALLSDTYPANQLGIQMGKVMIGHSMGMMAGPPLGGILQEHVGVRAPYVFCLILIVIDLGARLLIIEPRGAQIKAIREYEKQQELQHRQKQEPQETAVSNIVVTGHERPASPSSTSVTTKEVSTIRGLLTSKRLTAALFISFLDAFLISGGSKISCYEHHNFSRSSNPSQTRYSKLTIEDVFSFPMTIDLSALEPVLPLYLEHRFAFSETQVGLTFLALSMPTFISPLAGWFSDKYGAKIMSGIAISLCAIFIVVLGLPDIPFWSVLLLLVAIGSTCAVYITPVLGEISAVVRVTGEGDGFARAFALFNMCFSLGMVAGPLLGSLIYQETSMLWTCVLIACVIVVIVPFVFLYTGGRSQKLRDQAQYEKDKMEEDLMLNQMEELRKAAERVA